MQKKRVNQRRVPVKRRSGSGVKKEKEHSVAELYLHGLAGVIGLGVLVIPFFLALLYGGPFSIYLAMAAGFIALFLGILIYDISLTHNHDPYNFLKATSGKEYSFIFGFLLLVSFLITITIAGIAAAGELTLFFGVSIYASIVIVDAVLIFIWILFFFNKVRKSLNFSGALKIFFAVLLVIIGAIAFSVKGMHTGSFLSLPLNTTYIFAPFPFALLLFLWMYGGFEGAAIVYKGDNKSKVAKALIYVIITSIVLFSFIQLFVYASGNSLNETALLSHPADIFTANILSTGLGLPAQDVIVGLSIIVILATAFALSNAANRTLDDMSRDGIMPSFLAKDENLKLLVTIAIPLILITIFSPVIVLGTALFSYLLIVIISALVFAAAFAFFGFGYMYHYAKKKDYLRFILGLFVTALLLVLILSTPAAFLIGLVVILIISLVGYTLIK
ncbi:MAG: APC family permease [Candidatus Parvarchaeota archaeon]|jgi:amino acid transporter|nr:APC family permease [Candidatus Parvarchaeota archaeon]MCL5017810.1 APC family permease [Candidatus Parvarchaeota archaeon]